jgi:WD40 repeat protein
MVRDLFFTALWSLSARPFLFAIGTLPWLASPPIFPCSTASCEAAEVAAGQQLAPPGFEPIVQIGHSRLLRHAEFSPDAKYLVTTAPSPTGIVDNQEVILWDAASGEKLRSFAAETFGQTPHFCPSGQAILVGRKVWDLDTGKVRYAILGDDEVLIDVKVSADAKRAIVGTREGKVLVVDLESGQTVVSFAASALDRSSRESAADDRYRLLAVGLGTDNEPLALLAHGQTQIAVCSIATQKILAEFEVGYFDSARFSPDARYVIVRHWEDTGSPIDTTVVYEAATGKKLVRSDEWTQDADSVKFTGDGRFCVTGSAHVQATLWDLTSGEPAHRFDHQDPILAMRLLEEDGLLETQSMDVTKHWDLESGKLMKEFAAPEALREADESSRQQRSLSTLAPRVVLSPDIRTFVWSDRVFDAQTNDVICKLAVPALNGQRQPP